MRFTYFMMQIDLIRAKHAFMLLIYKKIHTVNLTTVNEISIGAIINIVSN